MVSTYTGTPPNLTQSQPEFDTNTQYHVNYVAGLGDELNAWAGAYVQSTSSTSSTSNSIGTGSKSFTVEAGKGYKTNMYVRLSASAGNYMDGLVTSYSGTSLVVNVTRTAGSGTFTSWDIFLAIHARNLSKRVVFASSGTWTWTVPDGVTEAEVIVAGAGGGTTVGGTSSFGSLMSATGGGQQISGVYGSTTNLAPAFNTAGVGVGGDVNLYGQVGTDSVNANLSGSTQTRLASATGGMTALGLGRGSNNAASETVSANGRIVARGGAGGGAAIGVVSVTPNDVITITIGASGGGDATAGLIIIKY